MSIKKSDGESSWCYQLHELIYFIPKSWSILCNSVVEGCVRVRPRDSIFSAEQSFLSLRNISKWNDWLRVIPRISMQIRLRSNWSGCQINITDIINRFLMDHPKFESKTNHSTDFHRLRNRLKFKSDLGCSIPFFRLGNWKPTEFLKAISIVAMELMGISCWLSPNHLHGKFHRRWINGNWKGEGKMLLLPPSTARNLAE